MDNKLAEYRKDKNLAQTDLCEQLGVSRQTISSVENGRCTPSLELAIDMANLLGVPVTDLFQRENRFAQPIDPSDIEAGIRKKGNK